MALAPPMAGIEWQATQETLLNDRSEAARGVVLFLEVIEAFGEVGKLRRAEPGQRVAEVGGTRRHDHHRRLGVEAVAAGAESGRIGWRDVGPGKSC